MNDDVKAAVEWLRELSDAGEREHSERGLNPVDARLDTLLAHIDGEPARTAAAVAAKAEEVREACAQAADDFIPMNETDGGVANAVRATPLTTTPLADRIAELEKSRRCEVERGLGGGYFKCDRPVSNAGNGCFCEYHGKQDARTLDLEQTDVCKELRKAEAERDAARKDGRTVVEAADQMRQEWAEIEERLTAERDALRARVSELEAEQDYAVAQVVKATDENTVLRAQVEAARAVCARFDRGGGLMWPGEVLAAIDGAKP